jgi:predicted deacylase
MGVQSRELYMKEIQMRSTAESLPVAEFRIADLPAGAKHRIHLLVDQLPGGQPLIFPTLAVRGQQPGPTLLVNAATHGDEYEGIVAIQDIFEQLDPAALRGTFCGIPVLNGLAFAAGTRESDVDHLNLARIFPGDPHGSPSLRIADAFQRYLLGQADLYIDMHSGGNAYAIKELAGYQLRPGELGERQRAAAIAFGVDLVWAADPLPGRTLSSAGDRDVPAIYVELLGEGRCRPHDRATAVQGIQRVMAWLDMHDVDLPAAPPPLVIETHGEQAGHLQIDHPSPVGGIFVPEVELWEAVSAGQRLGVVRHPDGTPLAEIPAARAGRILFLRTFPRVFSGDCLAYVLDTPAGAATS